jgi:DegV family protein with EDD domain
MSSDAIRLSAGKDVYRLRSTALRISFTEQIEKQYSERAFRIRREEMSKVAIVTDSNSGITQDRGKELGIYVLPMPFFIDEKIYYEDITLTQEQFYEKLGADSDISTSQPSPGNVMELWEKILKEYDEIVCIPMSSGLSSTCATATSIAAEYNGRVQVVNNQRISVTQEQSVYDAIHLRNLGRSASEIKEVLEREKFQSSIYITVDTLKYLKKGGRITPAAAAIGTVLNLKPVLQIQGEKLDAFAKVRGWKAAKKTMLNAIEKDLNGRFADVKDQMVLGMAYTCSKEDAQEWKQEIMDRFPGYEILEGPLSLSVACHIGPGAMAVTCMKKV